MHREEESDQLRRIAFFFTFLAILVLSFGFQKTVFAQSNIISGQVTDSLSGSPIEGVEIYTDARDQVLSDTNGIFVITLSPAADTLFFQRLGYETVKITLEKARTTGELRVAMYPVFIKEILVLGRQREQFGIARLETVTFRQIEQVPALAGEADLFRALSLKAGVANGLEGTTGLLVRGGTPDQNLVLLDGMPVYNTTHVYGFLSAFQSEIIHRADLIKGGMPARYGGRLSGILDIATHPAPPRERKRKLGIGLISSHLSLFGEPGKRTNYFLAGRTSYFNVLTAPQKSAFKSGADTDYNGNLMYDLTAKIDQKLFGDSELSLTIYRSGDQTNRWSRLTDGEERREEKNDVRWGNFLTSLNATFPLNKSLTFQPQFGFSSYRYSLNSLSALSEHRANDWYLLSEDQLESRTSIQTWQTRLDFTLRLGAGHRLDYGFLGSKNGVQPTQNVREEQPLGSQAERIDFTEQALYADYLAELSPQFHLQSGLRGVRYQRSGEDWLFLEPRFNLQWTHRPMLVYFAGYARMSQFLHYLNNPSLGLPTDTWLPASSAAEPMTADIWSAGISKYWSVLHLNTTIEGYYKLMHNVTEFDNLLVRQAASEQELLEQIETDGRGNAYGLEFSLAYDDLKSFQVEAAYTLSWNWRRFAAFNNGERYPSGFDRRHDLSIHLNKSFQRGWQINLVWVYASGRPVTLPSGKLFFPPHFSLSEQLFFDERNNGRLPAYHRMDMSISKEKNTKRDNIVRWGISVYNLYNRANPYFVRLGVDAAVNQNGEYEYYRPEIRQVSLLPIVPSAQFALEF